MLQSIRTVDFRFGLHNQKSSIAFYGTMFDFAHVNGPNSWLR